MCGTREAVSVPHGRKAREERVTEHRVIVNEMSCFQEDMP